MDTWVALKKPLDVEADIPLKDEAPEGVKAKYSNTCKFEFVAWGEKRKISGCIRIGRSILLDSSKANILELCEMEPAKGSGYVSLEAKSADGGNPVVIVSARHCPKALSWLKEIQLLLVENFELEKSYQYHGKDA